MRASCPSLVRSFLFACAVLLGLHASAQNFSGLSYQAVVRDNLGDPVANQPVGVQVTIQVGATGSYVETHSATTDAFGLIAITIGQGTPVGGSAIPSFAAVPWDSGLPITYSVAVDVTGGTNYTFLGGGPFKAVPFAMHALTSDSTAASAPQTLAFSNDTLYISNGNSVDLSGLADQPGWVLSGDTLHNDGRRVGIGTTTPDTTLHVVGGIQYQDGGQATGKLLTSDAQGNASWQALSPESIFGSGNVPGGAICLSNLATIATGSQPYSVAVSGSHAYVANSSSNTMQVFNISNPAAPTLSATIATGSLPVSVTVSGSHAYVVNRISNTMQVFNISNPAAPTLSATIATGVQPYSVAVSGSHAYVGNHLSNNMQVFNISDPAAPTLSATIATGSNPLSVAVSGNNAYVVNYNSNTMQVFNISNPAAPTLSATIATGTGPVSVAVSGSHAYVVNFNSGTMQVFNISNPAAPTLSATIATGSGPGSVAVSGSQAYVVNLSSNTMQVFNISNPAAPTLRATIATGSQPRSVAVSGSHAYVANEVSNTMQVFNLFCPNMVTMDPLTGDFTSQPVAGLTQNGSAAGNTPYWNGTSWVANSSNIFNNGGNVGMGTTTPANRLDVEGGLAVGNSYSGSTAAPANGAIIEGNVGIGTTTPANRLDVEGGLAVGNSYSGSTAAPANGAIIEGNVGIGTTTPQEALTVRTTNTAVYAPVTSLANSLTDLNFRLVTTRGEASNANGAATTQIGQAYGTGTMSEGLRFFRGTTTNDGSLALVTAGSERVRINRIGNVGIGTNNPIAPLHVVPNNLIGYNPLPITYFNYGAGLSTINWTAPGLLAGYFEGNVVCTQGLITTNGALTVSDRRLKKIVGRSDNSRDLALLDRIRVTDYTFIDSIALGNTVQKKVIAQELEEVYPNAIMYKQEHIPDVYTLSVAVRHAEGRLFVTLDKPHGLSEGDHLKWIEENGTAHFDSVACVTDAYTFAIPAEKPQQRIFVWGRRVNDLRTVDYDAVTMLNVSATQELHKLVRDLQVRNEALEQRNSVLDAELEGMRAQLEANTALMLKLQSVLEAQTRK